MAVRYGICGVFVGCILNAIFLEMSVKVDAGCGTLLTFSQFLFITVVTFPNLLNRHIPVKHYLLIVIVFFICNVCNNYAFNFNISMPLHMIFRSGSLITNMIMGVIILKRNYNISKYLSVGLITLGVIICTIVTGQDLKSNLKSENGTASDDTGFFIWLLGIFLLVFALFVSAILGIFQELVFKKYGKHPYEALCYTHMLPIPAFLLFYNNLHEHYQIMMNSETLNFPILNIDCPKMLLYLLGNVTSQYVCISSVYYLTTEATSLTVTLVITLRKFLSLLLSIVYFGNKFTLMHWVGTALVFIGTAIFTEVPYKLFTTQEEKREKKL